MPHLRATTTPQALPGITVGSDYTLQNRSKAVDCHFEVASSAPDAASDDAFLLERRRDAVVSAATGESIYVWAYPGPGEADSALIVFSEA